MDKKYFIVFHFCKILLLAFLLPFSAAGSGEGMSAGTSDLIEYLFIDSGSTPGNQESELAGFNRDLRASMISGDSTGNQNKVNMILQTLKEGVNDSVTVSESYYLIGVLNIIQGIEREGIKFLSLTEGIKKRSETEDELYAKCLFNMGVAYNSLGDYSRMTDYTLRSLDVEKKLFGEESPVLVKGLSSLVIASIELQEYEDAIAYGSRALSIVNRNAETFKAKDILDIYHNMGVCYTRLSDYSKSVLYFEKAESYYSGGLVLNDEEYINLLNNLAVTYGLLGMSGKSLEFYSKGIEIAGSVNSMLAFNFVNSYAIALGNSARIEEGEKILTGLIKKVAVHFGEDSGYYFDVLKNYAEYLRIYEIDSKKSLSLYEQCVNYIDNNKEELALRDPVLLGYALSLSANGESEKALKIIEQLVDQGHDRTLISGQGSLKADQKSLMVLKGKYSILRNIYKRTGGKEVLLESAATAEEIIRVLEKIRIFISEEESRLILGDRYRDSYLFAINDFNLCYGATGDSRYLAKIFEYSEKSKVAGLLTSTRELKAVQFHIPEKIAELERELQRSIGYYNAKITNENLKPSPDARFLDEWNEKVLYETRKRDSLITVFEKQYPDYYSIKYNTEVTNINELTGLIGKNSNYLNYIVSDTALYLFIANRKYQQFISIPVDSGFFRRALEFRDLLSQPSPSGNARDDYRKYCRIGYELYTILLEPALPYLISDKLLISPDNILSYIPFETILTGPPTGSEILYRELPYAMRKFTISYTYSVTLLGEAIRRKKSFKNSLISFAPSYNQVISIDSLLLSRQVSSGILPDIPYARHEAEFVADISNGKLYINNDATESLFKAESGKYDIIHLAMHTIMNDRMPMYSKMIFSQDDKGEDGFLNTYEIYGIPLKARMVVLSSCNTGAGRSYSGEGILSLARGFIYSGSQSVIMSLWEIEDRSGTDVVIKFYRNLKAGRSKSESLRKARLSYLKKADQLRSHPYFWSSLVVFGNNSPVYFSWKLSGLILLGVFFAVAIILKIFYRRSR